LDIQNSSTVSLITARSYDVFSATVLAKMLYCSAAWSGYCSAADRNRLDAFLRKAYKLVFYADISNTIMNRFDAVDNAFFGRIINNNSHVMRPLLHERLSSQYNLRSRHHDFTLINKTNLLTDNSSIIGMLYKNCILFYCAVICDSIVYCFAVCKSFY